MAHILVIDGTSGSGKTTVANEVAARMEWQVMDTGVFYRAITLLGIRNNIEPKLWLKTFRNSLKFALVSGAVIALNNDVELNPSELHDHTNLSPFIAPFAKRVLIRRWVNEKVEKLCMEQKKGIVVVGRDGAEVLPNATAKVFVDVPVTTRALRRCHNPADPNLFKETMISLLKRDISDVVRKRGALSYSSSVYDALIQNSGDTETSVRSIMTVLEQKGITI